MKYTACASTLVAFVYLLIGSSAGRTDHFTFRSRGGYRLLGRQNSHAGHHHYLEYPPQNRPFPQPELVSRDSLRYVLADQWKGTNFFNGFNFFTFPDPTHGLVNYLNQNAARSAGLVYVQSDGTAVMKVDNTTNLPSGVSRNSYVSHMIGIRCFNLAFILTVFESRLPRHTMADCS